MKLKKIFGDYFGGKIMKQNKIRIVCNPIANHISYYYKNELNEWMPFSDSSPLSRCFYTNTTINE